jgi:hypothetical protein
MTITDLQKGAVGTRGTRAAIALAAAAGAALVWLLAGPVLGLDLTVPQEFNSQTPREDLEFGPVFGAALIASLAGWLLLAVLERFTAKALTTWTVVAGVVFLLSLPYRPGFSVTERVVITLMHGTLATVLILGLRYTSQQRAHTR